MFNSPAAGGVAGRKTAGSVGSPPVAGVMKTPELNQVSQMMSAMGVGAAVGPQQFGMVRCVCARVHVGVRVFFHC